MKMLISKMNLPRETPKNVEIRGLSDIPAVIALTEKRAGVCFRETRGRVDYVGFFGDDPVFLNWVKDLFLYYWDLAKKT